MAVPDVELANNCNAEEGKPGEAAPGDATVAKQPDFLVAKLEPESGPALRSELVEIW